VDQGATSVVPIKQRAVLPFLHLSRATSSYL